MCLACGKYLDSAVVCVYHGCCFHRKDKELIIYRCQGCHGKNRVSEEGSGEQQPSGHVQTSACQTLLKGQMLIGQDGKLMKANAAQSESEYDMIIWSLL